MSTAVDDGAAAAVLTADQLLGAAGPRLHVPALAAALLKLLLLHGGVLLAHSMPPAAEALEVRLLAWSGLWGCAIAGVAVAQRCKTPKPLQESSEFLAAKLRCRG